MVKQGEEAGAGGLGPQPWAPIKLVWGAHQKET